MKKNLITTAYALAISSALLSGSAQAASCNAGDVSLTSITYAATGAAVPGSAGISVAPAECTGAYTGNDIPYPGTKAGQNLGYYGDGLVNGAVQGGATKTQLFPDGMFPKQYSAQDLNGDGKADPGWIYLGQWTASGFAPADVGKTSGIVLSSFLSITLNSGSTSSGSWAFTPDKNVISRASSLLGNSFFDQFALVFKSGDGFAAYDFTAAQLGLAVDASTVYNFAGNWDMSRTLLTAGGTVAGLSSVEIYARDPIGGAGNLPEPGTLGLLGVAMFGLGCLRRRVLGK